MKIIKDVFYGKEQISEKTLDIYIPKGECRAVFLYMHGGGLTAGSKNEFEPVGSYLANKGYGFLSVEYRMYPNAKYPEFIYDSAEAVAYIVKNAESLFGCKRLYVGGSSAGGYLSMMLCFDRRYYDAFGISNADIAGYFHDAGQPTAHYNVLKYSGLDSRRVIVDETSALYHVGLEKAYPPMRFTVSDSDMFGRYEQTQLMLKTLEHFKCADFDCKVMHGKHCEYVGKICEDGTPLFAHMIEDFLEKFN